MHNLLLLFVFINLANNMLYVDYDNSDNEKKAIANRNLYTYVSTKQIQKVKSPIDDFNW